MVRRVLELTCAAEDICLVPFCRQGVQVRLGLEIAHSELATHILYAISEHVDKTVIGNGGFQTVIQLVCSFVSIVFGILSPFFRLSLSNEFAQHIHIDALTLIMMASVDPFAICVLTAELGITAFRRNKERLYIAFKSFFAFIHQDTSFFPVTYS